MYKIAVIGAGNIGQAFAKGVLYSNAINLENVYLTKKNLKSLYFFQNKGFNVTNDNKLAVENSDIILIAVRPAQMDAILEEIRPFIDPARHIIVSIVTGYTIKSIKHKVGEEIPVVRIMSNTALSICKAVTCISANAEDQKARNVIEELFKIFGEVAIIEEDNMVSATILVACGIAYFLRIIRATSQGGIQIGFHSAEAIKLAAATARGAAELILNSDSHPEEEIDKVTTPKGVTIEGLNQMEHAGLSSAIIKGIVASYNKSQEFLK